MHSYMPRMSEHASFYFYISFFFLSLSPPSLSHSYFTNVSSMVWVSLVSVSAHLRTHQHRRMLLNRQQVSNLFFRTYKHMRMLSQHTLCTPPFLIPLTGIFAPQP